MKITGTYTNYIINVRDTSTTYSTKKKKSRKNCTSTACGRSGVTRTWLLSGRSQVMRDCAVWAAFSRGIQISRESAFVEFQRPKGRRDRRYSASIVAARAVPVVIEIYISQIKFKHIYRRIFSFYINFQSF